MHQIAPIETAYRGHRFRSRLEARWAVFFDALGIRWEYEPEGFTLPDGTRYLPDFKLHLDKVGMARLKPGTVPAPNFEMGFITSVWAEVKYLGAPEEAFDKAVAFADAQDIPVLLLEGGPKTTAFRMICRGKATRHRVWFNEFCQLGWDGLALEEERTRTHRAIDAARAARFEFGEQS